MNDNELYLCKLGQGKPLFFLHGGPGSNHNFFLPHMLPLKDYMELILYDQTGCGKSKERDDQNYSMNQEVDNLEMLRNIRL
ncbi:hypothetical protein [Virgibacillus sp. CBA3643]|uniref:hypothetical protein n=1 Tax=Virgibacillus sp. CBA3643 TaxID=2942278 RepID=UPI0035A37A92